MCEPGMVRKPCGKPGSSPGEEHRARSRPACPAGSRMSRSAAGPNVFWWKTKPSTLQRVVDADRLARDLLAVLVDGQVGPEVRERAVGAAGRLEVDVLDQQVVRRADRLDRRGLALADEDAPSRSRTPAVMAPPARKRIRPRWVSSVASLKYWLRSP